MLTAVALLGVGLLLWSPFWTSAFWALGGLLLVLPLFGPVQPAAPVRHDRAPVGFGAGGGAYAVVLTSIGAKPHDVVVALSDALAFPVPEVASLLSRRADAGPTLVIASDVSADEAAELRTRITDAGGQADIRAVA